VIEQMLLYPKEFVYSLEEAVPQEAPKTPEPTTANRTKKKPSEAISGFVTSVKNIPKSIVK